MIGSPSKGAVAFLFAFASASSLFGQTAAVPPKVSNSVPPVDFQRQIRPILSDNCFLCHGPDKGTRMVNLRLDVKDGALSTRKNGTVIVPGKPDESLLIKRVSADNPAFRMPPASSHKTLTQAQKDTLRRWIEQGAPWKEHWAFIPPVKAQLPEVKDKTWARNQIDLFLLAKMESANLTPAPEADRRTLIRRVTLDLTGLPPTPAEVNAFLDDKSANAYEKVVDRLLASPHYGEHRGRYWLDAARYADTQGLHIDNYREMWPYRDWVIQAFNRNMPFDKFTVEQLAGDLLPNASLDQKIASGFHRCNVSTNEGGAIPEEVAAMYAKDRADTTGTVWLGLTVGCATCHDHKFDPIAQKDYYSLTSFFRNTTQVPLDGNVADTPPTVIVPQGADRPRWEKLNGERATISEFITRSETTPKVDFDNWLRSTKRATVHTDPEAPLLSVSANDGLKWATANKPRQALQLPDGVSVGSGVAEGTQAIHFSKSGMVALPDASSFDTDQPFSVSAWVYVPKKHSGYTVASQVGPAPDSKPDHERFQGWLLDIGQGNIGLDNLEPGFHIWGADDKTLTARPQANFKLEPETWYHIAFSYDGSRNRKGISLFVNGIFVPTFGMGEDLNPLAKRVRVAAPVILGGRDNPQFADGAVADFRMFRRQLDESDAKLLRISSLLNAAKGKSVAALSDEERQAYLAYYMYRESPEAKPQVARLRAIDAERYVIAHRSPVTFVMQERTDSQPVAHVLNRGLYDQPKDEVHPKVPSALPPLPASYPQNRLGLAKWMIDENNPLPARVTVNRFWQELFGTGIVKTAEDFGSQGEPPSHPELLDWLAVDFRESGWDVKRMFRMMVTSAAYRQSSITTPEKLEHDPDNRLLAHGPRFRMDGEMVRDYALSVSGLLQPNIGGPSVKPYQPSNVWEAVAMDVSNTRVYQRDTGDKLYRRSMYTFWKRSAPPASMDIFNAPSRETCVVRRERTNTPLQALLTMNDPQFVEAARVLAQRALISAKNNLPGQVDFMASRLLARPLDPKELDIVQQSYKDYLNYYDGKPDDAKRLLSVGESKPDEHLSKPEFAAMTMVANEMLNLDEVLVK